MDSAFYDHIRLKELRRSLRLTQLQVAIRLGVQRQTIYRAEQGHSISFNLLARLAELYATPLSKILRPNAKARAA
jgi:transcriptional regulator with XRE-family HTH domain